MAKCASLDKNASFKDFLKVHDKGKAAWCDLWEKGRQEVVPSTVTFDPECEFRLGSRGTNGVWVTGQKTAGMQALVVSLPEPHNNGINFTTFTKSDADLCVSSVISTHPWMKGSLSKSAATKLAMETPKKEVRYDSSHGYWRSCIYEIVRDYATLRSSGVDPRADKIQRNKRHATVETDEAVVGAAVGAAVGAKTMVGSSTAAAKVAKAVKPVAGEVNLTEKLVDVSQELLQPDDAAARERAAASPTATTTAETTNTTTLNKQATCKARVADWVQPLDAGKQMLLYAPYNPSLRKYLSARNLLKHQGQAHWNAIREWTYTPEGYKTLAMCGLAPEGIQLDHICPKANGRVDYMYNCFFMPAAVNSHFKDRYDDEKKAYIGEVAANESRKFIKWYIDQTSKTMLDCSKYSGFGL